MPSKHNLCCVVLCLDGIYNKYFILVHNEMNSTKVEERRVAYRAHVK